MFVSEKSYEKEYKILKDVYLEANIETVLEQVNVPDNSDYLAPPKSYNLLGVAAGFTLPTYKQQKLIVNFEINNLLNTVYRDYLNRFRYYADEMGRNYSLKFKLTF